MRRLSTTVLTVILLCLSKSLWVIAYSPDNFQALASLYEETNNAIAESSEEHHDFGFNRVFSPRVVNFNEIFTNSLSMLADDDRKDDEFHNSLPPQLAEFRPHTVPTEQPTEPTTTSTTPKPRFLTAAYLKKDTKTTTETPTNQPSTVPDTTTTSTTTETPPPHRMKVLPLADKQRGLMDLIFPASRVRGFKSVFDTFRRVLSYTFRK